MIRAAFNKGYHDGHEIHIYNSSYEEGTDMAKAYHAGYAGGSFDWCLEENNKPKEQQMTLQQLNEIIRGNK
jgi:hypothetical protein